MNGKVKGPVNENIILHSVFFFVFCLFFQGEVRKTSFQMHLYWLSDY